MAHPFSIATEGYLDGVLGIATEGYLHDQVVEPPVEQPIGGFVRGTTKRDKNLFEDWLVEVRVQGDAKLELEFAAEGRATCMSIIPEKRASVICVGEARQTMQATAVVTASWDRVIDDDDDLFLLMG